MKTSQSNKIMSLYLIDTVNGREKQGKRVKISGMQQEMSLRDGKETAQELGSATNKGKICKFCKNHWVGFIF